MIAASTLDNIYIHARQSDPKSAVGDGKLF